jgi:protein phosphatase
LIDAANAAGGRDNITVVLFRVEDAGDRAEVDQPTMVGVPVPPAEPGSPAMAPSVAPPPEAITAGAAAPATASATPETARPARLARRQGRDHVDGRGTAADGAKRNRRYVKPLAALIAVLVVLFLVGGGGYLATRQLYFIGTNSQGIVTIFRGLPYDLPAGIHLYESFYVSGVPASDIPASRRSSLLNHNLRSQTSAEKVVRDLELGKIAQ